MGKNMQNTQWVKFNWKTLCFMLMYGIYNVLCSPSSAKQQYESCLLPGFCLGPEDSVLWDILPGPSLCLTCHLVWCYWEYFQGFPEVLGRFILSELCCSWCEAAMCLLCIKTFTFFSSFIFLCNAVGLLGRLLEMASPCLGFWNLLQGTKAEALVHRQVKVWSAGTGDGGGGRRLKFWISAENSMPN